MPASLTRNLITGGAGFVGSHLVDRLMQAGEEVICLDNYFTGRKSNIAQLIGELVELLDQLQKALGAWDAQQAAAVLQKLVSEYQDFRWADLQPQII